MVLGVNVIFAIFCAVSIAIRSHTVLGQEEEVWWKHANFYQIYPRSYMDSDNDGSGDLKGIISKLEYLHSINVENIWLSPIMESPMVDAGYDISNYRDINPIFGTMKDFEDLLDEAHKLGMRVILDFVPNHTSDQHVWFYKSMHLVAGYEDYYIWKDPVKFVHPNGTEENRPPNNWISIFLNSAWEWNEQRGQYYLHQFAIAQPDLNYRSPALVKEMKDIMRFWLDKGVDGFRVDAIPFLFEEQGFQDEPENVGGGVPGVDYSSLLHNYTMDQPETVDMIYQFRAVCDEYQDPPRVIMTEAYTNLENTMKYYGNETVDGASFTFNFFLLTDIKSGSTAPDFKEVIEKWINAIDPKYTSNWVVGNHDNNRTATRHGVARMDGINMLVNFLPGVGVTYNGEELALENGYVSLEDTQDPSALNAAEAGKPYEWYSRDFERTPFHWDSSANAGFNRGAKPWLPVSEKYLTNNVALQNGTAKSHLSVFKEIMELRQVDTLKNGNLTIEAPGDGVLVVVRELLNFDTYVLIFNVLNSNQELNLTRSLPNVKFTFTGNVVLSNVNSARNTGDQITLANPISLNPNEAFVLKTVPNARSGHFSVNSSPMLSLFAVTCVTIFKLFNN